MVRVRGGLGDGAGGARDVLLGDVGREGRAGEDVELAVGEVVEGRDVGAEVLRDDGFWVALEELRGEEGVALVEGAVVEDEQKLGPVRAGLDRVRHPGGEKPDVARLEIVDERLADVVCGGHAHGAVEDQAPFVGPVPAVGGVSGVSSLSSRTANSL